MKQNKWNKLELQCIEEATTKCFDEFFKTPYKRKYHYKSRKVKQARRHIIRYYLAWGHEKQIRNIIDDYVYWIARNTHKLLHPNTPNEYYLEKL